ncbi:MAG: helicase HerA-like domain-containing protein [Parasphingopyxis sp.]|uniref:helicase HerA-like domain-containing protein n=1 Tax=Parasphingopyxis sp. TaxID=1920299 RepID=UPI003FA03CFE
MDESAGIFLGKGGGEKQYLNLARANRHGLIAGATGTGKTVTVQGLAENFSRAGVPVFVADVKGDLSGVAMPGSADFKHHDKLIERAEEIGLENYRYADSPTIFWDLYGQKGHPIRTTISEMGPLLLGRLMDLSDAQQGVLEIAFRFADDEGMLLLDLEDLRAMLIVVYEHSKEISSEYGHVSKASVGAIQRKLLQFEGQGADKFFGEPALDIDDFFRTDQQGRGFINILMADKLIGSPRTYATFLLWLLNELFEALPEVGDPEKPKLIFFFDEAHLLFRDAPNALTEKIEQVSRLIRSKGVGIFYVTQNPIDLPEEVAGQLGNRILHALRAHTRRDQRAVRAAAETFRINPGLDVETAITELKVGEALVSTLMEDGAPSPVQRTLIRPPRSRMGPISTGERAAIIAASPIGDIYAERVDRESAAEVLERKAQDAAETAKEVEEKGEESVRQRPRRSTSLWARVGRAAAGAAAASAGAALGRRMSGRTSRANPTASAASAAGSTIGNEIGRAIGVPGVGRFVRGVLGGLLR